MVKNEKIYTERRGLTFQDAPVNFDNISHAFASVVKSELFGT